MLRSERSRDVSGFQVTEDCRRRPVDRCAIPASAAGREFQHATLWDDEARCFRDVMDCAIWHPHLCPVRSPLATAGEAPRAISRSLTDCRDVCVLEHPKVNVDARPATKLARAARVRCECQLLDPPRISCLPYFYRSESSC